MGAKTTKRMRLRYAGTCTVCGTTIAKGEWGIYDPAARTVRCDSHQPAADDTNGTTTSSDTAAQPRGGLEGMRQIRARRASSCALCGAPVAKGTDVWWNPAAKTTVCPTCHSSGPGAVIGVAGAGAAQVHARRQQAVQDRLVRKNPIIGRLTLMFRDDIPDSWSRGAVGEPVVGKALNGIAGETCIVLHDRKIPGSVANIDHIAVAGSGIWVIDAKHYRGKRPEIRDVGGWFNSDKRLWVGRDCTNLIDGLDRQIAAVGRALGPLLAEHNPPVRAALAFVDADWGWFPPTEFRSVRLTGPKELARLVRAPGPLGADQIAELATALAVNLPPGS